MSLIQIFAFILILFIVISYLMTYYIRPYFEKKSINEWLKHHPEGKRIKKIEHLFHTLYKGVNSRAISQRTRKYYGIKDKAFIYGEIEFLSFFAILDLIKPKSGEIFYDLGSGSGKAVFTAALCFDLSKAYGIELLPALYKTANTRIAKAKKLTHFYDKNFVQAYLRMISSIEFINDDFLNMDFSDGDIIYIAATCLSETTWRNIITKLTHLKIGSRVIVATQSINHEQFQLLKQSNELMSWGMNPVKIYTKIN